MHKFIVSDDFIDRSIKSPFMAAYLEGCNDPPLALYIISGLKIVHGAKVSSDIKLKIKAGLGAIIPQVEAYKNI
jgi:hypothetical protein